jgi:leucyl aminopeptidase
MTLQFELNPADPTSVAVDCLILGVYADGALPAGSEAADRASGGRLRALIARGDVSGKIGRTALLHDLAGIAAPRVLMLGLGEAAKFGVASYLRAIGDAVRALKTGASKSALCALTALDVPSRDVAWRVRQAVIAADHAAYRYTTNIARKPDAGLESLQLSADPAHRGELDAGVGIAAGVAFTRELGNLPPNVCTPAYLAGRAGALADEIPGVTCEVFERADMEKLGMGSLLAVARPAR